MSFFITVYGFKVNKNKAHLSPFLGVIDGLCNEDNILDRTWSGDVCLLPYKN
jgi:hypothetical protein